MADNFAVRVVSSGRSHFESAMRLAFADAPGGKTTHYINGLPERTCISCCGQGVKHHRYKGGSAEVTCERCAGTGKAKPSEALILFWHEENGQEMAASPLPFAMGVDGAISFAWTYLEGCDYPPQPDHDGDKSKGFIVTTGDFWGHVEGFHYSILMVQPDWQMYGK